MCFVRSFSFAIERILMELMVLFKRNVFNAEILFLKVLEVFLLAYL